LGEVVEEQALGPKEGLIRGRVMTAAIHGDSPCMRDLEGGMKKKRMK